MERTFKLTQCPSPALYPLHSPFACPKAPPSALSNPIHKPATGHKTRPAPMLKTHRLPPLNHQPIQLIKLTNNRLPLSTTTPSSALYFPYPIQHLPLSHHNSYPTPPPQKRIISHPLLDTHPANPPQPYHTPTKKPHPPTPENTYLHHPQLLNPPLQQLLHPPLLHFPPMFAEGIDRPPPRVFAEVVRGELP